MDDVPVYFSIGDDDNEHWAGMPVERALEWTRVFLRYRPSVPGTVIWMVKPALARGVPAGFSDWAARAHAAETLGFTPERYLALHEALDDVDPSLFPEHPDNDLNTAGLMPVRRFRLRLWGGWNRLVDAGWTADEATRAALCAAEL